MDLRQPQLELFLQTYWIICGCPSQHQNLLPRNYCFPNHWKSADVNPIFKEDNDLEKKSYIPASVLPQVSKVFERIMYTLINSFTKNKASGLLASFRKKDSTQHSVESMIENWKNTLHKSRFIAAAYIYLPLYHYRTCKHHWNISICERGI